MKERALFSTKAEYGVRFMMALARSYGTGPVPLTRVAEAECLPLPYLEQISSSLRRDGLIVSHRGARGGYELARSPQFISMGDVVRSLEGPITPMFCASEEVALSACIRGELCSGQLLWTRIRDAITGALDSTYLVDLVPDLEARSVTLVRSSATVRARASNVVLGGMD